MWGETKFQPREFPKVAQKQKTQKKEEKERAKNNDYNGQYLSPEPMAAQKWPVFVLFI